MLLQIFRYRQGKSLVTGSETALPGDIRLIIRNLQKLEKKDRKVVAVLVDALMGNAWGSTIS